MTQLNKNLSLNESKEVISSGYTDLNKKKNLKKSRTTSDTIEKQLFSKVNQVLDHIVKHQNIHISDYEKENIISQVMEQMKGES